MNTKQREQCQIASKQGLVNRRLEWHSNYLWLRAIYLWLRDYIILADAGTTLPKLPTPLL
jgi:hypothetical protein